MTAHMGQTLRAKARSRTWDLAVFEDEEVLFSMCLPMVSRATVKLILEHAGWEFLGDIEETEDGWLTSVASIA